MKKLSIHYLLLLFFALQSSLFSFAAKQKAVEDKWPDGTPVSAWFQDVKPVDISSLKRYVLTENGIFADGRLHTKEIQALIDKAAANGGGVICVPQGVYMTGGLFFKQGTHLYLEDGAVLMGSDFIGDYPLGKTRIEGETCTYFGALINVDGLDGFTISGKGTIDGNGLKYHQQFWLRRKWNRQCTNKDEQRPRLLYVSNSKNIQIEGVKLQNSAFWTSHYYNCENVKILGLRIYSLGKPDDSKGPSTDAIDLDVCKDVLIYGCEISVNDDAVVLKGGKGTWADKDPTNGPSSNVLIDRCHYGFVHGCLTLGSESLHDWNVILRNCQIDEASRVLWLKMRPDTPQHYEYVTLENLKGTCGSFLVVRPWTQFFKPEERDDMPLSQCNNIRARNIDMKCKNFFDVGLSDKYKLKDFSFENINVQDEKKAFDKNLIENTFVRNVIINGESF